MVYIVRVSILSVLFLQVCNAHTFTSEIVINFYPSPNQIKLNYTSEAPHNYTSVETSYYKYHTVPETWANARQICEAEGGYLAIINSEDEASYLRGLMNKYSKSNVTEDDIIFLGFHDYFKEGEYVTIDGKSIESSGYTHWAPGQPDNSGGYEHCGSFWKGGLNDFRCGTETPFVCEFAPDTIGAVNADTNTPTKAFQEKLNTNPRLDDSNSKDD